MEKTNTNRGRIGKIAGTLSAVVIALSSGCAGENAFWIGNYPLGPNKEQNKKILERENSRFEREVLEQIKDNRERGLPSGYNIGFPLIGYGSY